MKYQPIYSDEYIRRVRALFDQGLSYKLIGLRLGVSETVIAGIVHRNGFPPRPSPINYGQPPRKEPQTLRRAGRTTLPPLPSLSEQ
jgi:hypothetical protein